jgi:hypothetical protein
MKLFNGQRILGLVLVILSGITYLLYYVIFRENKNMLMFLVESAVFLPIQVLFVTLIVDQVLNDHERKGLLKKMNMVIGVFFSEVGTRLLKDFSRVDPRAGEIQKELLITKDWSNGEYRNLNARLKKHDYQVVIDLERMETLRTFLVEKRGFLVGLLENPNLLEHDTFTDLLWAVFHLAEELAFRTDVEGLPESDYRHLAGDMKRAYSLLVLEWLAYMQHLNTNYPYLFSLAIRTNPFDPNASVEVRS